MSFNEPNLPPAPVDSSGPHSFEMDVDFSVYQHNADGTKNEIIACYGFAVDVEGSNITRIYIIEHVPQLGHSTLQRRLVDLDETTPTGKFVGDLIRAHYATPEGANEIADERERQA